MQKSPSPWSFVDSSRVNRWTGRAAAALLALAVLAPASAHAEPPFASPPPVNHTPDPVDIHAFGPTTTQAPAGAAAAACRSASGEGAAGRQGR